MRPRALPLAFWALGCGLALPAGAACLTGAGSTGLEIGNQTLSVTPVNSPTTTTVVGISCTPNHVFVEPGISNGGTGRAEFKADHQGYTARTSVITGGDTSGSAVASALGSVRYVVRVDSTPSYAGASSVDLVVSVWVGVSGGTDVSGSAQAGGSYSGDLSIFPAAGGPSTPLFSGSGSLANGPSTLLEGTVSVDVDTDYVLQIVHDQDVIASAAFSPMTGILGSAASRGTVSYAYGAAVAPDDADPELSVSWGFEPLYGPPDPQLPPVLEASVPALPGAGLVLLALALVTTARGTGRRPPGPGAAT